jgi:exopolysaccharide biosynthesis polyprenyl glycosylphosphotransferase
MDVALLDQRESGNSFRARKFVKKCAVAARNILLPICDAFTLLTAALLTVSDWLAIAYTTAALIFLNATGRHRLRICLRASDEVPRLAMAAALPILLFLPWMESTGRFVRLTALSICLLLAMRIGLYAILRSAHRHHRLTQPALIVGTGKLGAEIGALVQQRSEIGLRLVGFVGARIPGVQSAPPVLGRVPDLAGIVREYNVRRIIVSFPATGDAALVTALRANNSRSVDICIVPRMYELAAAIPPGCLDEVWGIPLVPLRLPGLSWSGRPMKRAFDLIAGTALLIFLGPLLLALMGLTMLSCGRPVLFRQVRITRSGRAMTILKLRTVSGSDKAEKWTVAAEDCSRLGRWLRATHLDELPQLLNVLHGDMSLVGPRPERPSYSATFAEVIPHYEDRLRTNSGMTGWAQVHGLVGDTSISDRVRFDNYYIEHWSLWLDLIVLIRTLAEPLNGARAKQASDRSRPEIPPPRNHAAPPG